MSGQAVRSQKFLYPIDRVALGLMLVLSLLIGILLLSGDRTAPRVRYFSWQDKPVGVEDTAFILTFSRPMNHESVEANLKINPPLPGKFSWAGRRMAYTPEFPTPYGTEYRVELKGAKDQFSSMKGKETQIEPFSTTFRTRDRAFVYVGVEGDDQGRLILYNLTQQKKAVLTPPDLVVVDFKPYPDGDRILFSANDRQKQTKGMLTEQLYTVTTGLSFQSSAKQSASSKTAGKVDLVLDSKDYQNLKFDLSQDGNTIVVQRVNRRNPAEFGLWVIPSGGKPRPLENQPGGDFLITADSASVAIAQGQGIGILPLTPAAKPLDFLADYGQVLSFARDNTTSAMVKFNPDPNNPTRSLFYVTNQGVHLELLRTTGSILDCEFTPNKETLYCLLTQLIQGEEYQEEPFVAAIDPKAAAINLAKSAAKAAAESAKAVVQANKTGKADEVDKAVKAASEAAGVAAEAARSAQATGADKAAKAAKAVAEATKAAAEAAKAGKADEVVAETDKTADQADKIAAEATTNKVPVKPLVVLPNQRNIQVSLSPDGLALLFDQLVTVPPSGNNTLRTDDGQAIATGYLWLLPLVNATTSELPAQLQPEQLLPGFHPRWLP